MSKYTINKNALFQGVSWILFLGVLPFEKAALTFYISENVGAYISLALNVLTVIVVFCAFFGGKKRLEWQNKLTIKYLIAFVILATIYIAGTFNGEFEISRLASVFCLLAYYLYIIDSGKKMSSLLKDLWRALFAIIIISFVLYLFGNEHVMYIEDATSMVFKGITANRNSYSEISLFFVAIDFCLYKKGLKSLLGFVVTSGIATYTTFLTNGAANIVCIIFLLVLLFFSEYKSIKKHLFFVRFLVVYFVLFSVLVIAKNFEFAPLVFISNLFEKSSTITGRSDLWAEALAAILKAPIWGYGYDTTILMDSGALHNDPHNGLLYILLTQGLMGSVYMAIMIYPICRYGNAQKLKNDVVYRSMMLFSSIWLFKGLVESVFSYTHFAFWCAIIIMEMFIKASKLEKRFL